jgi:hypothetical protein
MLAYQNLLTYSLVHGAPLNFIPEPASLAAQHGHIKILEILLKSKPLDIIHLRRLVNTAATAGQQNIIDWIEEIQITGTNYFGICLSAAQGGHITLIQRYFEKCKSGFSGHLLRDIFIALIKKLVDGKHLEVAHAFWLNTPQASTLLTEQEFYELVLKVGQDENLDGETVKWALKKCPSLAPFQPRDGLILECCLKGELSLLKLALENGGKLDRKSFKALLNPPQAQKNKEHFECLKYLHEKVDLSLCGISFPFDSGYLPSWATKESAQWMKEHQYVFQKGMLEVYFKRFGFNVGVIDPDNLDKELIAWMLHEGEQLTQDSLLLAAYTCDLELLNWLSKQPLIVCSPEFPMLKSFFSHLVHVLQGRRVYVRLTPIKRTVQWLLSNGYSWGTDISTYSEFYSRIYQRNPKREELLLSFVEDLNMPYEFSQTPPPFTNHADRIDPLS